MGSIKLLAKTDFPLLKFNIDILINLLAENKIKSYRPNKKNK